MPHPYLVPRPQRWDQPLDPDMGEEAVARLMAIPPFAHMAADRFPVSVPLEGLLKNDTRILDFAHGDIILREGDFGTTAYLILEGQVLVAIDPLPKAMLGRIRPRKPSWLTILLQAFKRPSYPEVRREGTSGTQAHLRGTGQQARLFIKNVEAAVTGRHVVSLEPGDLFGEMAALGRNERSASVIANGAVRVLEIRWPGLRDLRKYDPSFKQRVDALYRERGLFTHLKTTPLFAHLDDQALAEVVATTTFEAIGQPDWHVPFKANKARSARERLEQEQVIVQQGDYVNGVIIIRNGFARTSRREGGRETTQEYLGHNKVFGLEEVMMAWREGVTVPYQQSLRALGYVEAHFIPSQIVEKYILGPDRDRPLVDASLLPTAPSKADRGAQLPEAFLEPLVEERIINGTSVMAIDLHRCTGCDDCVKACANAHDHNPRFLRQGLAVEHLMVAHACMHCVDPVCLLGCPTAAIHRDSDSGQVLINDQTCVGCGTCATSCPYDNIRMVEIRDAAGNLMRNEVTHQPLLKATKCDLCIDERGGPACVRACPHDALARVDLGAGQEGLAAWLSR